MVIVFPFLIHVKSFRHIFVSWIYFHYVHCISPYSAILSFWLSHSDICYLSFCSLLAVCSLFHDCLPPYFLYLSFWYLLSLSALFWMPAHSFMIVYLFTFCISHSDISYLSFCSLLDVCSLFHDCLPLYFLTLGFIMLYMISMFFLNSLHPTIQYILGANWGHFEKLLFYVLWITINHNTADSDKVIEETYFLENIFV